MFPEGIEPIYHYTSAQAAEAILQEGFLRPRAFPLYLDFLPVEGRRRLCPPVIWCTRNPVSSATIVVLEQLRGTPLGNLRRFTLPEFLAPLSVPDYAVKHGIPAHWFRWNIHTASLVGEQFEWWQLAEEPVAVEIMTCCRYVGLDDWRPL